MIVLERNRTGAWEMREEVSIEVIAWVREGKACVRETPQRALYGRVCQVSWVAIALVAHRGAVSVCYGFSFPL